MDFPAPAMPIVMMAMGFLSFLVSVVEDEGPADSVAIVERRERDQPGIKLSQD